MKFWGRAICFAAVIMIAPPMLGLIGTFIDIHQSMGSGGIADTKVLADHISRVLLYTLGSMVIAVIGLVLLIISTCRFFSCRAKCRPPAP